MATIVTTNGPDFEDAETIRRNKLLLEAKVPLKTVPEWTTRFEDEIVKVIEITLDHYFEGEYQTLEDFVHVARDRDYEPDGNVRAYFHDAFGDEKGEEIFARYKESVAPELDDRMVPIEIPWSNIDYIVPDN